ncbi:GNAT family N-acetyltransferase [Bradyrhizobium sp. HKCCYLS2038]|uniref:GNAT family N-acetyltransferase n=1 Tax=unclassified Bradyrhizobium TaxID=2631580 RepID=UPI003EB83CAC
MTSLLTALSAADLRTDTALAASLLALNNAHASELSWLMPDTLTHLLDLSRFAWRTGGADALMIALDETAPYDNPNHRWFRGRYDRFVYVDRIVVARAVRGRGLARQLYEQLIRAASAAGHDRIVCEINLAPPNPQSDAFHAALGFEPVGTSEIHGGTKTVRYMLRRLR